VFLGRNWYKSHGGPPTGAELETIPVLSSEGAGQRLFDELRRHGAVSGRVTPKAPRFDGAVYLLVDRRTASASEVLAHALKVSGRATLVGSRTAGSMLTALPHALRDGWVLTIPEADFIAADGTRIEGKGVPADLPAASGEPFLVVADQIKEAAPYSSAVLRAGSLESLQRPAEAERAYKEALSVADRQDPVPHTRSRANVHKRIAFILKGRGDHEAARKEYAEVLQLDPEDAEAKAALRRPD
jgi:tetratricopeptide (TPR) repeat protein